MRARRFVDIRVRTAVAVAVAFLSVAGCSSSETSGPPPSTRLAGDGGDAGPPRATVPGRDPVGGDGGTGAAAISTEGTCGLLLPAEIDRTTGVAVDASSPAGAGCRWLRQGAVVV